MDNQKPLPLFTDDQIRTLQEFADNLAVGRRAFRILGWLCGFIVAMATFLYYIENILQNMHASVGAK